MKAKQLQKWADAKAITARDALKYGDKLRRDSPFILAVISAAEHVRTGMKLDGAPEETFAAYLDSIITGKDDQAEAERALARAVAPLLLGDKRARARLRRILDCIEDKESGKKDYSPQKKILHDAARNARTAARREELKGKRGFERPPLASIVKRYRAAGGTLRDLRTVKRYLRQMGFDFAPMAHRGKDKGKRKE